MMAEEIEEEVLSVLESAEFIVKHAQNVSIKEKGVENAVNFIIQEIHESGLASDADELEPHGLNDEEILEWTFLLDTLNFCFWSDVESELFTVHYRGKEWTGYKSMRAALCRAVEEKGIAIYSPSYYGEVTLQTLQEVFSSSNGTEIPLLQERLANLHEAADVLHKKFGGKVRELIRQSDKSVQKLIRLLINNFSSYRDITTYKDQRVSFLKRPQIFAADVWYRFNGTGFGEFNDINTLTMFADYRVPQCLVYLNILQYSDTLMDILEKGVHISKDSQYEIEIRGSSIWAVELICRELRERLNADPAACPPGLSPSSVYPCSIDFLLWAYAKQHSKELSSIPIHRTRTIFY